MVKDGRVLIPAAEPIVIENYPLHEQALRRGLLDRDIFTQDITATRAKSALHTVGLITEWAHALVAGGATWEEWRILLPLTSEFNDSRTWTGRPPCPLAGVVLSGKANYPEAVIRLFDMSFTDAGRVLFRQGPGRDFHPEFITGKGGWWVEDLVVQYRSPRKLRTWPAISTGTSRRLEGPRRCSPEYRGRVAGVPLTELPRGKAFRDEMDEMRAFLVPPYPNVYLHEERLNRAHRAADAHRGLHSVRWRPSSSSATSLLDDFDRYLDQLKARAAERVHRDLSGGIRRLQRKSELRHRNATGGNAVAACHLAK